MTLTTLDPVTALVVVDLQAGVVAAATEPHTTAEVLDRSVRLAQAFRTRGLPVVLVRVDASPPGRTEQPAGAARPEGWDRLVDELGRTPEDIVVTKQAWGAFHSTDLDARLRERDVTQVVVTGVSTSRGVESTARSAHELGYHVTTVTDAMADRDEVSHEHTVTRVFPSLGETGTTEEVLDLLAHTHEAAAPSH